MLNIPTTEQRLGKSPQRLVRYFLLFMGVVYVGVGIGLWWTAGLPLAGDIVTLPGNARRVLGAVFAVYGALRLLRVYQAHFRKQHNLSNDD